MTWPLRGQDNVKVQRFNHQDLKVFGVGADLSAQQWRAYLRQAIAAGLIDVDHQQFGSLRLTEQARPVLRGEQPIQLRESVKKAAGSRSKRATPASAPRDVSLDVDGERRFEALREWRRETAKTAGVPPYVVFHDRTLIAIAERNPADTEDLAEISGFGEKKLAQYGAEVLAVCVQVP